MSRILVIDDKDSMREMLETVLGITHDVRSFADPRVALKAFGEEPFDLAITDVRMPAMDGIEVLRRLKATAPDTAVIVMTGFGKVTQAVEAMRLGAFDYLAKPFEPDEIAVAVDRALDHRRLRSRAERLEREASPRRGLDRLIGTSAPMHEIRSLIERVAPSDATVLLQGASGTGKEVVARAIHECSTRAAGPFVVVHCAALPRDLAESELFGHLKGAFSGAASRKPGLIDEADGGTLFLDDVNYFDLAIQAKVNRVLQEREIKPLGSTVWKRVDVRIIASANVDLEAAVQRGEFRGDLYYRLKVFTVALPALDRRREDVSALARHFVEKHGARLGKAPVRLSPLVLEALAGAPWPGNVRELENAIERALILGRGDEITLAEFPDVGVSSPADIHAEAPRTLDLPYAEFIEGVAGRAAAAYVRAILARYEGNVTRAAEHAGVSRQHLHKLMKKLGISETEEATCRA